MEQKYDVFISYSRKDYLDAKKRVIPGNVVSQIKDLLAKEGITYWFDEEGIYSGQSFTTKIVSSIEASRIFLFLSTENSNKSRWTCKEIATADELGMHIIPVRIDQTPYSRQVLFRIADLDYVEYYANPKEAMQDIVHAIKTYLQEQSMISAGVQETGMATTQPVKQVRRLDTQNPKPNMKQQKMLRILLPLLIGLILAFTAWLVWPKGSTGEEPLHEPLVDTLRHEPSGTEDVPTHKSTQLDTVRVRKVLEQYARNVVEKDFAALETLYAPHLERFQESTNVTREKVIESHQNYEQKFSAVIRSATYRWETLKVIPLANGNADVVCVQDFHLQRTANSTKPNYYVLEQHFRLNSDYQIVSVFDIQVSKTRSK